MPFFLSDEFKSILDEKIRGTGGGMSDNLRSGGESLGNTMTSGGIGGGSHGASQMYKSIFLKEKLVE